MTVHGCTYVTVSPPTLSSACKGPHHLRTAYEEGPQRWKGSPPYLEEPEWASTDGRSHGQLSVWVRTQSQVTLTGYCSGFTRKLFADDLRTHDRDEWSTRPWTGNKARLFNLVSYMTGLRPSDHQACSHTHAHHPRIYIQPRLHAYTQTNTRAHALTHWHRSTTSIIFTLTTTHHFTCVLYIILFW